MSIHIQKRSSLKLLVALVKPRIIELLLVTAVPALIVAAKGWPNWSDLLAVVGFGTMAAAGANAWNSIIERDLDAQMNRTKHRPLVTGEITVNQSAIAASILTGLSILGMLVTTNLAAAALTAAAIGFYVLAYTIWLKPRTNQNIVWGGVAGCFPVIIAESAVNGKVSIAGWILFLLIFFWTPAHYWPLAAHFKDDYARVEIPMLPVAKPPRTVANWTLIYTALTVVVAFFVYQILDLGLLYLITSTLAGLVFIILSIRYLIQTKTDQGSPMVVFHFSITYLAIVFLSIAVDVLIS